MIPYIFGSEWLHAVSYGITISGLVPLIVGLVGLKVWVDEYKHRPSKEVKENINTFFGYMVAGMLMSLFGIYVIFIGFLCASIYFAYIIRLSVIIMTDKSDFDKTE